MLTTSNEIQFKHERGIHCITTAMSNILHHQGIALSEELCFGIGSGLGFTYTRGRNIKQFLVFGRSDDLELNVCEMLGVHANLAQHANSEVALNHIIKRATNNQPVIVDLDISKLPYLANTLKWPGSSSHGGHKAVFGGYDSLNDHVLLYEYLWSEPKRLNKNEFFHAWNSFNGLAPACNLWYEFEFPNVNIPLEMAIKKGIMMNVYRMLSPWNTFHGIDGLKAFLRECPNWHYLFKQDDRVKLAYASYISLEIGGTGKGAFRKMFYRFLKIAAEHLKNDDLLMLSKDYLQLSSMWSELAGLLYQGSLDPEKGIYSNDVSNETLAKEIYEKEAKAIYKLKDISEKWI